jgi:hypothetical protein
MPMSDYWSMGHSAGDCPNKAAAVDEILRRRGWKKKPVGRFASLGAKPRDRRGPLTCAPAVSQTFQEGEDE